VPCSFDTEASTIGIRTPETNVFQPVPRHTEIDEYLARSIIRNTMAEPTGYLTVTQTRDDRVQLLSSKNHYVFNLAWLKALPVPAKE
jgi:hypothetical protein